MSPETKLKLLRQRMSGLSESVAELRRREMEYMSLVRIQVRPSRLNRLEDGHTHMVLVAAGFSVPVEGQLQQPGCDDFLQV